MEGKRLVTKPKIKAIGDELNAATAFIQSSNALDVAAMLAEQRGDTETLLGIASLYMQIGERLAHPGQMEDEEEEVNDHFGFVGAGQVVEVEDDVLEEDEEFEDAQS